MTRTVALLGATGYTGRLVAAELERRGIPHRLGGRSRERLAAVPSTGERYVVDIGDPASLDDFVDSVDVIASCLGPFALHGRPAVDTAVRHGLPYVDSTGEWSFMAEVYRRHRGSGPALVPACGFDYVPGDLGSAVAAASLGTAPTEIDVVYQMSGGGTSRGTAKSGLGMLSSVRPRIGRLDVEGAPPAMTLPWGEQWTVPLHQPQATVRTGFAAPGWAATLGGVVAPLAVPALRLTRPLLDRLVERMPEGPSEAARGETVTSTWSFARSGKEQVGVRVQVRDAYGMTARFLVAASQQISGTGALATAEALDPKGFLDAMAYEDEGGSLSWDLV